MELSVYRRVDRRVPRRQAREPEPRAAPRREEEAPGPEADLLREAVRGRQILDAVRGHAQRLNSLELKVKQTKIGENDKF